MNAAINNPQRAQLQSFCSTTMDSRAYLQAPWLLDGMAYASNAHWIVRMPCDGLGGDITPWQKGVHPKDLGLMFDAAPWQHLQVMELVECAPCEACKGGGQMATGPCPSCDGTLEFVHHGVTYECWKCDGDGLAQCLPAPGASATTACEQCCGTGFWFGGVDANLMEYRGVWFQRPYMAALSRLPGVEIAVSPNTYTADEKHPAAAFKFDGGHGLLMPCRPPEERANAINTAADAVKAIKAATTTPTTTGAA